MSFFTKYSNPWNNDRRHSTNNQQIFDSTGSFFICLVVLCVGLFLGYQDLKFSFKGKEVTATFIKMSEGYKESSLLDNRDDSYRRRNRKATYQYVRYKFVDHEDKHRIGYDRVDLDWRPPGNRKIDIEYIPGKMMIDRANSVTRLKGGKPVFAYFVLIIGCMGSIMSGWFWWRGLVDSPAHD